MPFLKTLSLFGRCKFQQHIARQATVSWISGINENHSVDDHRPRAVKRSAFRLNSVHCLVFFSGVEIP